MRAWLGLILLAALGGVTLSSEVDAADFLFFWNASPDPTVTGFVIYQRCGDSPYERIDEVFVADLDDPARPSYLMTGLEDGSTYWFAVAAIFPSGAESDLSGDTCVRVNGQVVECSDDDEDGATIIVSCFIRVVDEGHSPKAKGR